MVVEQRLGSRYRPFLALAKCITAALLVDKCWQKINFVFSGEQITQWAERG